MHTIFSYQANSNQIHKDMSYTSTRVASTGYQILRMCYKWTFIYCYREYKIVQVPNIEEELTLFLLKTLSKS